MVASITRIHSSFFLPLNQILSCYCRSQMFELCHIFWTSVSYMYAMIFPCILVTRQQHMPRFLCVFFIIIWFVRLFGTAATSGLLCQPRVIVKMIMEKQMECRLAGETEFLGENLLQRHFCPSQNSTWPDPGLNQGRRGGNFSVFTSRLTSLLASIKVSVFPYSI
jgi:hypothetical protein